MRIISLDVASCGHHYRKMELQLHHWREWRGLYAGFFHFLQWCFSMEYEIADRFFGRCFVLRKFDLGNFSGRVFLTDGSAEQNQLAIALGRKYHRNYFGLYLQKTR
ncbi:hypothetical protein D3C86_1915210 [compost metagenome]